MRKSGHPRAAHLHEELHVEIVAFAPPAEAYARMAYALTQVRRYLIPDNNDQVGGVCCACAAVGCRVDWVIVWRKPHDNASRAADMCCSIGRRDMPNTMSQCGEIMTQNRYCKKCEQDQLLSATADTKCTT